MALCRSLLTWLLCALVVLAGAPRRDASCGDGAEQGKRSCCGARCHCSNGGTPTCACGGERKPAREPQAPLPRQVPAPAPLAELQPRRDDAPVPVTGRIAAPRRAAHAFWSLPARSRQEVLSVWRC